MFLSRQRIFISLNRLNKLHPFFGTVFLALKKAGVEPASSTRVNFAEVVGAFLQEHYIPPGSSYVYNPFRLTSKSQRWNGDDYVRSLQTMVEDLFSKVLVAEKGGRWAWQPGYVQELLKLLPDRLIPTFDLAVWLFHPREWAEGVEPSDVLDAFFSEFHIADEERVLFDPTIPHEQFAEPGEFHVQPIPPEELWRQWPIGFQGSPRAEDMSLQKLELIGVGPAKSMEFSPAPRLNIITGDNGLGKTFLLECAWWALTGTWATDAADAREDAPYDIPRIVAQIGKGDATDLNRSAQFDWELYGWSTQGLVGNIPGIPYSQSDTLPLSIFAQADGSFTILDPSKQVASAPHDPFDLQGLQQQYTVPQSITLSTSEVWLGTGERDWGTQSVVICNGLLSDWTNWRYAEPSRFRQFTTVLKELSPNRAQPLVPGRPMRWSLFDAREMPTLQFPYGEVPLTHCSAGIRRIVALAYMLVWAWHEHVITSKARRREPRRSLVLLVDEMEAHLHPFWQRMIVPALMDVMKKLAREVKTQLIIATHSPLVLASVETRFDEAQDRLFHLDVQEGFPHLEELPFFKRGRSDHWLTSEVIGLKQPRSKEAEDAIEDAKRLQQQQEPSIEEVQQVSNRLLKVLAENDDFWPRWLYFAEQRGAKL